MAVRGLFMVYLLSELAMWGFTPVCCSVFIIDLSIVYYLTELAARNLLQCAALCLFCVVCLLFTVSYLFFINYCLSELAEGGLTPVCYSLQPQTKPGLYLQWIQVTKSKTKTKTKKKTGPVDAHNESLVLV